MEPYRALLYFPVLPSDLPLFLLDLFSRGSRNLLVNPFQMTSIVYLFFLFSFIEYLEDIPVSLTWQGHSLVVLLSLFVLLGAILFGANMSKCLLAHSLLLVLPYVLGRDDDDDDSTPAPSSCKSFC